MPTCTRRPVLTALAATAAAGFLTPLFSRRAHAVTKSSRAPKILVFDVAETLLDIDSLAPFFSKVFGDPQIVHEWFGQTILYAETATVTKSFTPFSVLAAGVLRMVGKIHGVSITGAQIEELGSALATLPPYPDVPEGLRSLKQAGYRLVTLTDSAAHPHAGAFKAAGLDELFEREFSAETVHRFKPALETYQMVAEQMQVGPDSLCMIAAHPWDLIGAQRAGCSTALLTRKNVAPFSIHGVAPPDVVANTLPDVARALGHA
jgi:2-haloacid dehalogenase